MITFLNGFRVSMLMQFNTFGVTTVYMYSPIVGLRFNLTL